MEKKGNGIPLAELFYNYETDELFMHATQQLNILDANKKFTKEECIEAVFKYYNWGGMESDDDKNEDCPTVQPDQPEDELVSSPLLDESKKHKKQQKKQRKRTRRSSILDTIENSSKTEFTYNYGSCPIVINSPVRCKFIFK